MSRVKGECSRPGCDRLVDRRQLCRPHYDLACPLQGYADPQKARGHIKQLRAMGVTLNILEGLGVTRSVVARLNKGIQRIHLLTEAKILAIPFPAAVIPSRGDVPSIGTVRRLRALAAIGWTQIQLAEQLGWSQSVLANHIPRARVSAKTAVEVDALFQRLQLIPGPSAAARSRARSKGWAPPMAYDNIDDPAEKPDIGAHAPVSSFERVVELQQLGVRDVHKIAERLGTKPKSVERLLARHQKGEAA